MCKKLFNLLDYSAYNILLTHLDINSLTKISLFSKERGIDLESLVGLYLRCEGDLEVINTHNIQQLLDFIRDERKFVRGRIDVGWGPGNYDNPKLNLLHHYRKHILDSDAERERWKDILPILSEESYRDYAINSFYKMQRVVIHSNGKTVYLSGFYENVFIIGRYHEGIFGLSSCYYVELGEKEGRYKDLYCKFDFGK